ncbi:MAG: hypothetical protein ACPGLV_13705 [Bacteroidia bacterium]
MKLGKLIIIGVFSCIALFLLVFGMPIHSLNETQCNKVTGVMHQFQVHEGSKDIRLRIEGDNGKYYINRGLENGIDAEIMRNLKDKEVEVWYAKHWSLLNYKSLVRHVGQITINGEVVYTEFKNS